MVLGFTLFAEQPKILWWFDTYDSSFGQTAMDDINNDGKMNVVFGCYRNDSTIYALNTEDGSLLWKFNTTGSREGCNDAAPLIFDVDRDGLLDVVVASSCNPYTYCFEGATGEIKWQAPTRGSDSPPTVADLDGDGKYEILHGQFGGYVVCLNGEDGSQKWEILVDPDSWVQTAPTIVDLDSDGVLDFVVATWNFSDDSRIYAYRGDNQQLLWETPLAGLVYHGTAVADLYKNGKPELVIGDYSGTLSVIDGATGNIIWTYNAGVYIAGPVSIGDIDGDGFCEIVFVAAYQVTALNYDGTVKWKYDIPDYKQSFRGVVLSDINDDSLPDVIFGTSGGDVIALEGTTGNQIFSLDLAEHLGKEFDINHAPVIGDFNNNGILDLFIVGGKTLYPAYQENYGRAYAIEIGKGAGPYWKMFQKDVWRRGSLCEYINVSVEESIETSSIIVYPNPARDFIEIVNNDLIDSEVKIYSLLGELVAIGKSSRIEIKHLPAGVYFVRIAESKQIFVKY
jgi:outer membrane protein assembly factor BamB